VQSKECDEKSMQTAMGTSQGNLVARELGRMKGREGSRVGKVSATAS
jgi:hypothetical protein